MKRNIKHSVFCEFCGAPVEKYFSVETCARLCDLSIEFFRKRIRKKEIGFVKIGGAVRIPASELIKIIRQYPNYCDEIEQLLLNKNLI